MAGPVSSLQTIKARLEDNIYFIGVAAKLVAASDCMPAK
jgi:hypothetical protein